MSKGLGVDTGETSDGGSVRAQIGDLRAALGLVDVGLASDRERIGLMTELTELVAAVAAAQTRLTAAYADSQRALGATGLPSPPRWVWRGGSASLGRRSWWPGRVSSSRISRAHWLRWRRGP